MSDYNREHNRAVWFDIPVTDLERATTFYAAVLNVDVSQQEFDGMRFSVLAHEKGNGGCLVPNIGESTSTGGILLYLNVHSRIRHAVQQVVEHGGSIQQDVHSIGPHGFRAIVVDSEGNRIALHSEDDA